MYRTTATSSVKTQQDRDEFRQRNDLQTAPADCRDVVVEWTGMRDSPEKCGCRERHDVRCQIIDTPASRLACQSQVFPSIFTRNSRAAAAHTWIVSLTCESSRRVGYCKRLQSPLILPGAMHEFPSPNESKSDAHKDEVVLTDDGVFAALPGGVPVTVVGFGGSDVPIGLQCRAVP